MDVILPGITAAYGPNLPVRVFMYATNVHDFETKEADSTVRLTGDLNMEIYVTLLDGS